METLKNIRTTFVAFHACGIHRQRRARVRRPENGLSFATTIPDPVRSRFLSSSVSWLVVPTNCEWFCLLSSVTYLMTLACRPGLGR